MKKPNYSKMITDTFRHMQFIGYIDLRDRFDYNREKLLTYWTNVYGTFQLYQNDELSVSDLSNLLLTNGINCKEQVLHKIPQRQKMILSDYRRFKRLTPDYIKYVDSAIYAYLLIANSVLLVYLDFTSEDIKKFNEWVIYYVDLYVTNYITDDIINDVMKDECNLDIKEDECGIGEFEATQILSKVRKEVKI